MPDTLTVSAFSAYSTDGYLTSSWGSGTSYTCRWVQRQTRVKSFEGVEELSRSVAWVASTSTFGPADRYVLPDGSTGELLSVDTFSDEGGNHHVRLHFG